MLDAKDIEILLVLQNNPLATLKEIANKINMSVSGTDSRLKQLIDVEKAFHNVRADLNLEALELEIHDFIFEVKTKKNIDLLEKKFSYYHPYLLYRSRCNGKLTGLYLQFRIPKNALAMLIELFDKLVAEKIIENHVHIKRDNEEKIVTIKSSLKSWNLEKHKWEFNWKKWIKDFHMISERTISKEPEANSVLNELTELDLKLLAELTLESRRKNVEIIKKLGIKMDKGVPQRISRRMHFLNDYVINDHRIFLNWESFDLYQSVLIRGYCDLTIARKIRNYLMIDEIEPKKFLQFPFESIYFITDNGFAWYVRAPPSQLSHLNEFIWEVSPNHHLYLIDYSFSRGYGFWPETFNLEEKKWRISREFMVDNVLQKIKEKE